MLAMVTDIVSIVLLLVIVTSLVQSTSPSCRKVIVANDSSPIHQWTRENTVIQYGNQSSYRLLRRLGAGGFGEAYLAIDLQTKSYLVAKTVKTLPYEASDEMVRELSIMQSLCGGPNIVKLVDVLRDTMNGSPVVVMEHVTFTHHKDLYPTLSLNDFKFYLRQVLIAIQYMHEHHVMHRDIKPHNVLIDHSKRTVRVIDFGLSHWHFPGMEHDDDSGTRAYMAPEVLLGWTKYNQSIDIWSFGAMFAGIIFRKDLFFKGSGVDNRLRAIVKVLGTKDLIQLVEKYNISHDQNMTSFTIDKPRVSWSKFVTSDNKHLVTPEALDLLNRTLVIDPAGRSSASELLSAPFFV